VVTAGVGHDERVSKLVANDPDDVEFSTRRTRRPRLSSVDDELLPIWRETLLSGEALPSEEQLAETIGASRPAIREALIRMEANGLVRRLHGAGTFANPAALDVKLRLDNDADFADRLASVGYEVAVELLRAEVVELDAEIAAELALEPGTRALQTLKRWRADGVVAVVALDHVPLSRRITDDVAVAAASAPVRQLAADIGLGRTDWLCTWPTAVELDADIAALVEYEPGRAALRFEQLGVARIGGRVFHAVEHHRPGIVEYGLVRTVSE
jgi:GntR family transcriptional regulator